MTQWLREWWRPALKCRRVGHDYRPERKLIRVRDDWPHVAEDYEAVIDYCARCGQCGDEPPRDKVFVGGYSSVTMPSEMWRTMRSRGYVVIADAAARDGGEG